ncbi:radical SAM protein [Streptomyces sp. NPDC006733]|uniref:radical SAM protein n=1 Tax=Streptomyces sp. NPDC006733 TaxID=3155460 RepID=UPI0033DD515E
MYRVIRGTDCYWAVGTRRVARLPLDGVFENGRLTGDARGALENAQLSPPADTGTYHMTVLITTRCNLACAYCFQNAELPSAGPGQVPGTVPVRIAGENIDDDRIADILAFAGRQMERHGADKLGLMLFGGEPTLHLDLCLKLLEGAAKLGPVTASMISNGTLFTVGRMKALQDAGLRSVQVTFDGDVAAHDRSRITVAGRGTFARIVDNLAAVSRDTSIDWQLRVNLTGDSLPGADALVDRLAGRLDTSKFALAFAPVHDPGTGFADTVERSVELAERVGRLYGRALHAGFRIPLPRQHVCETCGEVGGRTGSVVNSDGTLYSCWESAGKPGYEVGTVDGGYFADDDLVASRWVACGYPAENRIPEQVAQRYADTVDGMVLDRMYTAGLLGGTAAAPGAA